MKSEEIALLFKSALDNFEVIAGQPSDADVVRIGAALCQVVYPIPYDTEKGIHNLTGAILGDDGYNQEIGA